MFIVDTGKFWIAFFTLLENCSYVSLVMLYWRTSSVSWCQIRWDIISNVLMSGDLAGSGKGDSQLVPLLYKLLLNSIWCHHPVAIDDLFGFASFEKLRENNPFTDSANELRVSVSVYCSQQTTPLSNATSTEKFACFPQSPSFLPFVVEVRPLEGFRHTTVLASYTGFYKWICFLCEPNPIKVKGYSFPTKPSGRNLITFLAKCAHALISFFANNPFFLEWRYLKLLLFKSLHTVWSPIYFMQASDLICHAVNDLISLLSLKSVLSNIRSSCLDNFFGWPGLLFLCSCTTESIGLFSCC